MWRGDPGWALEDLHTVLDAGTAGSPLVQRAQYLLEQVEEEQDSEVALRRGGCASGFRPGRGLCLEHPEGRISALHEQRLRLAREHRPGAAFVVPPLSASRVLST